jgi:pimeloyl-ACP methyl ester carboxylesterase
MMRVSAGNARGRRVRRLPRILTIVGLAIVAVVAISTVSNVVLTAFERGDLPRYGEKVSIETGEINVSVTGSTRDGARTVVLLSGYGTASPVLDFTPLVDELDDDYKVVVVERFGYGYSDNLDVPPRTVENVSTELHEVLAELDVTDSYVLLAHSIAGIYALDYVNRYPGEVSTLVTLDGTVPEDFAVSPHIGGGWERALAVTGWVRWMTALNPAITAPTAPTGVYSEHDIERIRLLTIWNYANPAMIDENNRSAENFAAVQSLSYPPDLPVLAFLSQQLTDANSEWLPAHEQQLESVDRSELRVLDGGHYLHWTHSMQIADSLDRFLG